MLINRLVRRIFRLGSSHSEPLPPIRGVNLGGWLVLERWMTPGLFPQGIEDEYTLCKQGGVEAWAAITRHRDNFITLKDFQWLAAHGITAVRLPVGYWVFGDADPYLSARDHVDKAFQWADQTGIRILIDVHAAPGSQNGKDHSGQKGPAGWHKDQANVIRTLQVVKQLAVRYKNHAAFLGIELLNEPSSEIPKRILKKYYRPAYRIIRDECGPQAWVVLCESYGRPRWRGVLSGRDYTNVYIDTHQYPSFDNRSKMLSPVKFMRKVLKDAPKKLRKLRAYHPVIVGEWSAVLDAKMLRAYPEPQQQTFIRSYAATQLLAYEDSAAWFYWSYKTSDGGAWSFREMVERGVLPFEASGNPAESITRYHPHTIEEKK